MAMPLISVASPLSPDAALQRALEDGPRCVAGNKTAYQFVGSQTGEFAEQPALYIFNRSNDNGYVIVSADDKASPLLGYSAVGSIAANVDERPDGFNYWMDVMARRIESLQELPENVQMKPGAMKARPERKAISPLLKSKWNQSTPFNDLCPKKESTRTYTGCVATAMAQVMYYYKWPETGEGNSSYKWNNLTLKLDYSAQTFDWANMLDTYVQGKYNDDQAYAAAQLMKACGYSVEMDYGLDGSGAMSYKIGTALGKYFKYDKSVKYLRRQFYSLIDWENYIYESLSKSEPVIYDGQSLAGGHSFVCDGYDKNGYFHFNWGWAGLSDGYFLLDALDPDTQGIGGSLSGTGFDFMQDIIVGIRPDKTGKSEWSGTLYAPQYFVIDTEKKYAKDEEIVAEGGIYNYGPGAIAAGLEIGIRLTPAAGDEPIYATYTTKEAMGVLYGYSDFSLYIPEETPAGTYTMDFVQKYPGDEDYSNVLMPLYLPATYTVKVGSDVSFIAEEDRELKTSNMKVGNLYTETPFKVTASVTNPSERPFFAFMTALLYDKDYKYRASANSMPFDLEGNQTAPIELNTEWARYTNNQKLTPGTYYICLAYEGGEYYIIVSDLMKVEVKDGSTISGVLEIEDNNVPATYYNMQGVRIAKPQPGLPYIIMQGGKTRKQIK